MRRAVVGFAGAVVVLTLCAVAMSLAGCNGETEHGPSAPQSVAAPPATVAPLAVAIAPEASPASVPRAALPFRAGLIRTARAVWGMQAPIAAFAGQLHQESGWRPDAVSKAGAAGLAQFMPATSKWIAGLDPELKENQPFNTAWAMRALVTYDLWLFDRTPAGYSRRDRMWVALRAYNGGLGHWQAEARNAASPARADVDAACGTAKRARSHCKENLGYPERILVALQPRYASWGAGV
jgi:soluble lytic murein transglycosylase-like protein